MRKNIAFAAVIAITLVIAAGCAQYVWYPVPVPGGNGNNQSEDIYVISEGESIDSTELQNIIDNYDGIKGPSKENPVEIPVSEPLKIAKDFTFDGVKLVSENTSGASSFSMRSAGNEEEPIGIDLSSSTGDITLTIKNSTISGFGYAIKSNKAEGKQENGKVKSGSLSLIIENSTFSDCFKGLYATDIKDLTITGSKFDSMGTLATAGNVIGRSGSAIDINQMSAGGTITITNSIFINCGNKTEEGTTSGAIKIKVRGDIDDRADDIPWTAAGSFEKVTIQGCNFGDTEADKNRADVVLGTSKHASTDDFEYDIQECNIENNAAKLLSVNGEEKVSELTVENYDGIIGTGTDSVIIFDQPLELNKTFSFENITLDSGKEATEISNGETPVGINLSGSTEDIALTIKNCTVKNFGYAINSNKANGDGGKEGNGTVNSGSLTLVIEDSDFSNCYKGLYATDIKNMRISDNSTFTDMGRGATGTGVIERSGSAIDINQMSAGEIITITDSSFTNCGGADGTTSGAIKVKVRGGKDDIETDIPAAAAGSLKKLIVNDCYFSGNRADIVIGTKNHPSTGEFDKDLQSYAYEDNSKKN